MAHLEFEVPEGYDISDYKKGVEKEVLAKVKLKDDGTLCFTSIEGYALKDKDDEEYEDEEENEDEPEVYGDEGSAVNVKTYPDQIRERASAAGLM